MKIPIGWLSEFVECPKEPKKLADDLTLAGLAVDGIEKDGKETLLDLDITTNRVDAMNVFGIAREIGVLYGKPLKAPDTSVSEKGAPARDALSILILAEDLCPRFLGRVLDVRIGPSPAWLRERLEMMDVRSLNNVVDITNYVMLELGQPSHAFDLLRIPESALRIRWAKEGERLKTLDGVERALSPRIGVVAGPESPLGLAGIMGGASSEVSDDTKTIALEAAYWDPPSVRRASKALGLHTEASHRFERGADPEGPPLALDRIAHLLTKIGAGTARPGQVEAGKAPARRKVGLRKDRVEALLGVEVPEERVRGILKGLGFGLDRGGYEVPSFRGDVSREEDLIEEVGRHYGFDKIPSALPATHSPGAFPPLLQKERALQKLLVGFGLTEVVTLVFVSESDAKATGSPVVALDNPLAEDQAALRNSLVLPGLLSVLQRNIRHGTQDVEIFEFGRVFDKGGREVRRLGILLAGAGRKADWSERGRPADFFDLKGILESFPARLEVRPFTLRSDARPFLHPGRSARLERDRVVLGYMGALHPDFCEKWEVKGEVLVAELDVEPLFANPPQAVRVEALPRFPVVSRDISVVVNAGMAASSVAEAAKRGAGKLAKDVFIVDRYAGPELKAEGVALTVTLRLQDPERTLTSEEAQASVGGAIRALKELGAQIRGE
jgi:phenylalanyl-tRNA synthetase beta chain